MSDSRLPAPDDLDHRALGALLLRSLAVAILCAAGAPAALAWIGTWEDAPHFGVVAYLFVSMLAGAGALLVMAKRLAGSAAADRPQRTEGPVSQ